MLTALWWGLISQDRLRSATSAVEQLPDSITEPVSLLNPLQHTSNGTRGKERLEEIEHTIISNTTQTQHRPFQDLFNISPLLPPTLITLVHCHQISTGFEPPVYNPLPGPNKLCWSSSLPSMLFVFFFFFFFISPCVFIKRTIDSNFSKIWIYKHLDDIQRLVLTHNQRQDWIGWSQQAPVGRRPCRKVNSQWQYQDAFWDSV